MNLLASCAFGLEAIVARELQALGYSTKTVSPGQIQFTGEWRDVARTNLWLRCADRVSISLHAFPCDDFDCLFETIQGMDWAAWLPHDAQIHVTGSSVKSQLTSVPAVQRTTKKAIVTGLLARGASHVPETGNRYRIHIGLRDNLARLTLDTTGASLHKRGYREISTRAPLKETLAAALVQLSFWQPGRPLIDPFCGGGTILIEAAMIGRNLAPGRHREFAAEAWPQLDGKIWQAQREEADALVRREPLDVRLIGRDHHAGALSLARRNAHSAEVTADIHFQQGEFADLSSKKEYGVLITNPPYGERLDEGALRHLYQSIPLVLRGLPTWSHYLLTAYPGFEKLIGKQADRRRKLYNGRIECTYYQFHGPKPGQARRAEPAAAAVFGGHRDQFRSQAELFASRLRKRARHLRRWPTKRGIRCFRLYERDIPEIPLVVDRYEDHLHIVEFERPHDRDLAEHAEWLEEMARTAGETLEVPPEHVHLKSRFRQRGQQQHEKVNQTQQELIVHESGLQFLVNLEDYTDTGLFLDHREARKWIRERSRGKQVLNLFAYTGAFSVFAADGGAEQVTTVDWSNTYVDWAQRNFRLNDFSDAAKYRFVRSDAREFLVANDASEFDLIICDPPTFSNSKRTDNVWDVQRDHVDLINLMLARLTKHGEIFFSTNFRRIRFAADQVLGTSREITKQTLPEEYRNRRIHRSWIINHRDSNDSAENQRPISTT